MIYKNIISTEGFSRAEKSRNAKQLDILLHFP